MEIFEKMQHEYTGIVLLCEMERVFVTVKKRMLLLSITVRTYE